jgi:ectoine hydroxylase-related dioxygenase (phytanoyl-CoA dioxygenase family)
VPLPFDRFEIAKLEDPPCVCVLQRTNGLDTACELNARSARLCTRNESTNMVKINWERVRNDYTENGVAVIRGVISASWIDRVRAALEDAMTDSSAIQADRFDSNGRRFHNGFFHWQRHSVLRAWAIDSALPEIAARVLASTVVRFFYDQTMVKEPGVSEPTPWHRDLTYWPLLGEQILTIWVPFDNVDVESGAVTYARGSHQRALAASDASHTTVDSPSQQAAPDVSGMEYESISWDTEPGDCIVHHPRVLHMAGGNKNTSRQRRATAMRYVGDDVRWNGNVGGSTSNMFNELTKRFDNAPQIQLAHGQALEHPQFPLVWPRASH